MKKTLVFFLLSGFIFFLSCKEDSDVRSFDEQLAIDVEIIDNYLDENGIDAQVHESGIRYVEREVGTGDSPTSNSKVIVKYKGTFLDGTTFDSNDIGVNFNLAGLIESWRQLLPEMKEGGEITMYAPSGYCYGRIGSSSQGIPANAILVFEIELVSLVRSAEAQLAIDIEKIDQHLAGNEIEAQIHSSGIRYIIVEEGTGINPTLTDQIKVNYTGRFLDGEVFDEGEDVSLRLNDLITAWKTMLPTVQEGATIIIYSPSGYCFGNTGSGDIPPNENLVFDIDLISVNK